MDRRYQVFISSTFTDLIDERREVMQALLEMDCLPAGMELFPAGNTDQWTLIKGVIEQSDYYLVILGGRYGSTTEEGISYTEKEYDYAIELGIPVMGFVPAEPDEIPVGKTDRNDAAAGKLAEFRKKVQLKMTRDWTNAEDLGSKVTRGLMHLIKNNPRPGWVRFDQSMVSENRTEIAPHQELTTVSGTLIPPGYAAIVTGEQDQAGEWVPPGFTVTMGPGTAADDLGNTAVGSDSRIYGGTGNTALGAGSSVGQRPY